MLFPDFPENSRVWLYQSQRPMTHAEQVIIQDKMNAFLNEWAAHGDALFAAGSILEDYFIVLVVDELKIKASGCSIDTSVKFVKEMEKEFSLNLFDRMNILCEQNGTKRIVHFSDLSALNNAEVFNPMIQTLKELRENWKVPSSYLA